MAKWYEQETNPIGTHHIQGDAHFETVRTNNFEFIILDKDKVDYLLRAGVNSASAEDADYISNGQEIIRLAAQVTKVPNFTQNALEHKRGNNTVKMAGVPTFEAGSLKVMDYIGCDAKSVIYAWQRLSYDVNTQKVGRMYDWTDASGEKHYGYKFNCKLVEYAPDYTPVRSWDLKGCWISGVEEPEFNATSNELKQVTATIQYDYAVPLMPDEVK